MKHTPGPWELNTSGKAVLARENGHGRFTVCVMQNQQIAEQEANARLIAAAPALLAALSELLYLARIGAQETGEGNAEIGRAAKLLNDLGEKP